MKLLVAIDYSQPSQQVLNEVVSRVWPAATTACVFHVIDSAQLPTTPAVIKAMRQSAEDFTKSAAEKLCTVGVQATAEVREGHARVAIADYAKEWGADLVLVGAQGAGGVARFLLGSVAQATLRKSPCSVEIVRVANRNSAVANGMKILIAVDGSEHSMAAVRSVARRPWPVGRQISMLSVVPIIVTFNETLAIAPAYYPSPVITDTLQREAREQAEEAVARAWQVLVEAGIKPTEIGSFPMGDPKRVILDEAKNRKFDLIVVGSHGYRGMDRVMLGSVSEAVAMHAHCSVEVVREPQYGN